MMQTVIETIPILPFGMLNAFLVIRDRKAVLVDTGLPQSEIKIHRVLKKHNLDWTDIKVIVLTHAHVDHAGSAVVIQALTSAPIIAHELEIPFCQGEPHVLNPTGLFGRLFFKTGAIQEPFEYFTPDRPMTSKELSLSEYGFPKSTLLFTPGHTPGSLSIFFEDGRVIAGDLAASGILLGGIVLRHRAKCPPFEEDSSLVAASLDQLLSRGGRKFYICHGVPLPAKRIAAHSKNLKKIRPAQN
nr:MBL fold metallo-hydrolase [uncultured Cohaesibacter sp.]